jgi:deferrochelatase/peroxidase EfeB
VDEGARLSRRSLLGLAGGLGLAVGAGVGVGVDRALDGEPGARETIPFHGLTQAGITTPQQERLAFAAYDLQLTTPGELRELLRTWTTAAGTLATGSELGSRVQNHWQPPNDTGEAAGLPPARLTITFGFGPTLFETVGLGSRRPSQLASLPPFPGDELDLQRSDGDLCVQACADDAQVAFHAVRNLTRLAFGSASLRWLQTGFLSSPPNEATPRNLMGFKDGSNNLDPSDRTRMAENVWADGGDGQPWMAGGTYLVARRIRIRTESWDRTPIGEQEQIFGRHKADGAPLGGRHEQDPVDARRVPADAHIRLANPRRRGSERERILRRGYNFADGLDPAVGELDAGLFFLAYQRDPRRQFVPIQARLAASDGLNEYIQHRASAVFAIPPGTEPGGYVGATLLGATR